MDEEGEAFVIGPGRRWEIGGERREWQTRGGEEREERTA